MILAILNHHQYSDFPSLTHHFPSVSVRYIFSESLRIEDYHDSPLDLVVIGGGPQRIHLFKEFPELEAQLQLIRFCASRNIPVIGLCLGCQLIAHAFGCTVGPLSEPRLGHNLLDTDSLDTKELPTHDLLCRLDVNLIAGAFSYHKDGITVPPNAPIRVVGRAHDGSVYIIRHDTLPLYGFQSHPEAMRPWIEWLGLQGFVWKAHEHYKTLSLHFWGNVISGRGTKRGGTYHNPQMNPNPTA